MSAKSIAQLCGAKLQHFFELSKKNVQNSIFFSLGSRDNSEHPSGKHQSGNEVVMGLITGKTRLLQEKNEFNYCVYAFFVVPL